MMTPQYNEKKQIVSLYTTTTAHKRSLTLNNVSYNEFDYLLKKVFNEGLIGIVDNRRQFNQYGVIGNMKLDSVKPSRSKRLRGKLTVNLEEVL